MSNVKKALIIAGESSGELYGALLAHEIKTKDPLTIIKGVGGQKMKQAGVELIAPINSAFGITEAIKTIVSLKKTLNLIKKSFDTERPNAVILIDYPDFNFKVAMEAKKRAIPVLYYVSPQVWAWRPNRIHTISKIADFLALILPFEKDFYKTANIKTEFVGHPVVDEIKKFLNSKGYDLSLINSSDFKKIMKVNLNIDCKSTLVALLPGSRRHEVISLLPPMIDSAVYLRDSYQNISFIMPIAINLDDDTKRFIKMRIGPISDCLTIVEADSVSVLSASDYAIVASGTASFQCAILNVPMVVIYKVSPITFFIGKLLVNINHIALSNVILEKTYPDSNFTMIKELMQKEVTAKNIIDEIKRLMHDDNYCSDMLHSFERIRNTFVDCEASKRVAELFFEISN